MSLFQCENCGCCENVAISPSYFCTAYQNSYSWVGLEDRKGKMLCSACGPTNWEEDDSKTKWGIWHGQFDRVFLPKGMFKTNKDGNLEHIETGSTDFRKYEILDGLKLMLQFYANQGQLKLVENKTGVSVRAIEMFLENDRLSLCDRSKLEAGR